MLALDALGTVDQRHPADASLVRTATDEFFGRIDRAAACRALADAAYDQYLAAADKRCFIDKTPRYWMVASFIDALYPEAPQIVLLRNPYAIAASLKSTWGVPLLPETCPPAHSPYLADLVIGLPLLAARRDRSKTQVVRYETLVAKPSEEIRRIITALGYDPAGITSTTMGKTDYLKSGNFGDRKILDKKTIDDRSVHAWQTELSVQEMQAVTDMVGADLLIELGYEREFQWAREAGVIDNGEAMTRRHRQVFQIWWHLRSGRTAAAGSDEPPYSWQRSNAAPQPRTESSPPVADPSVMQVAEILAESSVEQVLRLANTKLAASETDRAARLNVIQERDATIATQQSELARLEQALATSEADRATRLGVIRERDATIAVLQSEVTQLGQTLAASEADRAARLNIIQERDATIAGQLSELARLCEALAASEADRAARLNIIQERDATIAAQQSEVARLTQELTASEADRAARLTLIHERDGKLATLQSEIIRLRQELADSEADRATRMAAIREQETTIADLQNEITKQQASIAQLNEVQGAVLASRWWRIGSQLRLTPRDQLN